MNEAETRAELVDPALKAAGWGITPESQIRREFVTPGRLLGNGKRGKSEKADYVLVYRNHKLAVIEAKKRDLRDTEGVGQAKKYAEKLQIRFAYSTNGRRIYQIDMHTGQEQYIDQYPTPEQLWAATFPEVNQWRDRFSAIPFEDKSGTWEARYYQHNAITQVLEAIATGKTRILLTMATGTGKTFIAFQLAWKLFQSRWNLSRQPTRRPRILFLADRNILANQAFNSFSAFPDDALVRIDPEIITKKGRVPKNGSIFFTIFQTFMTGTDDQGDSAPNFGDYPPDFFDFIIIDECHRGGASDESTWRGILEYFAPAVQLGLTATPKRTKNTDTYTYFGEPVYTYALKDGINDGFLTPFKVKQIETTLDEYIYTADDIVLEGEVEEGKRYTESDFNRTIEMEERERYRVRLLMDNLNPREKTLVFCASQDHALFIRDLINQMKTSRDPNYCVRVTANDGKDGEQHLSHFQDNEKSIPTILTTSRKLSTGVDARNVRNIVLLRPIKSMIEFKQIIGRGTRLYEGKDYFTIYDFVGAYQHFNDPAWDGEPETPTPITPGIKKPSIQDPLEPGETEEKRQPQKVKIQLADGKEREIQHTLATSFWSPDGKPLSAAEFIKGLFGTLPELFQDENQLRELWSSPDTRQNLLDSLTERGYSGEDLLKISRIIDAEKSDIYDVLAYIAYATPPITRSQRVLAQKRLIFSHYDDKQQEFLEFVLEQYMKEGVQELREDKLGSLLELKYHGLRDAVAQLGKVGDIRQVFISFQQYLYKAS
ncbi:EcoAI/FtnUII family type I restriction enzme subunit R [Limnospira platensis]|uniref:EcoAI/FtnUII family type I restriction enzme subunit R n=1 Tax=Limnospira platensis TaxID=118562 RepID=UPI0002803E05|nr:type III restriction protein res subunit [Arthrospira platensis C1]UWU46002.1 type I restriction enzyme, R subunit [Arthrospira platensis C1]